MFSKVKRGKRKKERKCCRSQTVKQTTTHATSFGKGWHDLSKAATNEKFPPLKSFTRVA